MSQMLITELPDLCQRTILFHLPIRDQLVARGVCQKWRNLMPSVTLQVHSLTLLIGSDHLDMVTALEDPDHHLACRRAVQVLFKEPTVRRLFRPFSPNQNQSNCLAIESLGHSLVEQIIETFTNIKELRVVIGGTAQASLDTVTCLLRSWSTHLTKFRLQESLYTIDGQQSIDRLYTAINKLATLKHLSLHLYSIPLQSLPLLAQLESFTFFSFHESPRKFAQILLEGPTSSLAQIEFGTGSHDGDETHFDQLSRALSGEQHLLAAFTRLRLYWVGLEDPIPIAQTFPQLTTLHFNPSHTTFRRFFTGLCQLKQLVHLRSAITFEFIDPDPENDAEDLLPQVKSIQILELLLFTRSHGDLAQMNLAWTIPNVQVLELEFSSQCHCTECGLESFYRDEIQRNVGQARECLRAILGPLKRGCTKLKAILHNREADLGTAEELLAE